MTVVRQFHQRFGLPHPEYPTIPRDPELIRARMRLLREEYEEVMQELTNLIYSSTYTEAWGTLGLLLKELCDLRYSVEGTAVAFGLPIEAAYLEVHRSNMTKQVFPAGSSKVAKGPNYVAADMGMFIPPILEGSADEEFSS